MATTPCAPRDRGSTLAAAAVSARRERDLRSSSDRARDPASWASGRTDLELRDQRSHVKHARSVTVRRRRRCRPKRLGSPRCPTDC